MKTITLFILTLIPYAVWAQDITLTLSGSANNYKVQQVSLLFSTPDTRDTSRTALYIGNGSMSFLRFDVSELPVGTTIKSAQLYLFGMTNVPESWKVAPSGEYSNPDNSEKIMAHMWWVQTPWSPSTISLNNRPWYGDDLEINERNLAVPANGVPNYKLDITSYVAGWVSQPATNNGFVFYFERDNEKGFTNMNLYSGQARPELQPRLVITYEPPPTPPICTYPVWLRGNLTDGKYKQIIYRGSPGHNDSTESQIEASVWWDSQYYASRSIMRYDVSAVHPGSTVTSAKLHLYAKAPNDKYEEVGTGGNNASWLEQVMQPWSSATLNPVTHPAVTKTANRKILSACYDIVQDYTVDVTDFVQSWVNIPDSNFGMQLRFQTEDPNISSSAVMIFHSAQAPPDKQPWLEICYTPVYNPLDSCTVGLTDSILALDRKTHAFVAVLANNNAKPPARVCWSFGDGSADTCTSYDSTHPYTGSPILHTYSNEYTSYAVRVIAQYEDSCTANYSVDTKVASYCTASFSDSAYQNYGLRHSFKPSVTNNQNKKPVHICWSFGDGADSCFYYDSTHPYTGAPVVHTYLTALSRTVCMTVRYDDSCTATFCNDLKNSYITSDSMCSVGIIDSILTTGIGVHSFRPSLHNVNGRAPVLICWSFGDGTDSCASYDTAHPYTGAPVNHTYPNLSSYEVTLTVIYADSCAATNRITVQSSQCSAYIGESEGYSAEHHFFLGTYNSLQKSLVNICWSFGDGADTCQSYSPGITDNARHTYAANGLYKACATAYFQDGCVATGCKYANYVNCDSSNLVIHGNPTNGKYWQTVVTSGQPQAPPDATQRDLIAVKNYMYYDNAYYLVRTTFRYELGEIPASAVVLNAHLYLHAKDTVINGSHSSNLYYGGNIESVGGPSNVPLVIGVPNGDVALDMTSFVQYWVNHPERNAGAVLHTFPEDAEDALYVLNYYGGLAPDSLQPRLEICYAVPYQPASQAKAMTTVAKASPVGTASAIDVSLYPNPATDALNIRLQSGQAQTGAIYLYDMQGRLLQVLQQHVQYGKGMNSIHVPVNRRNVHAGIYLVKIQAGAGSYTYKIVLK